MNKPNKGDVLRENYGRRVVIAPITEKDGKKYVTFFTCYNNKKLRFSLNFTLRSCNELPQT